MQQHNGLLVETIVNGPFMENCFLVAEEKTKEGILIDPGDEEDQIVNIAQRNKINIKAIYVTHSHIDHVGAVAELKKRLKVPFSIHSAEKEWLLGLALQAANFGLSKREVPTIDNNLEDGQTFIVGNLKAQVIFTPGHSAGGCCFYFADQKVIFVGDTLFAGSIGRTDLPGGGLKTILNSIKNKLMVLPNDVVVYSGHGPSTTIGHERSYNPFLQQDFVEY